MEDSLKKAMLDVARKAIMEKLTGAKLIDKEYLTGRYPRLAGPGAVFVTLNKEGQLRGCIGSIEAHRMLLDDIIHNARAAAFSDSRFQPVEPDEMEDISIEISLLSKPEEVIYSSVDELKGLLVPGKDGVILSKGFRRAVFLPQVWDKLPSFDVFFYHLCLKAGLEGDCIYSHPGIYRFEVEIFEEER